MKKALPLLALLLVLAGVVVFTRQRAGGGGANFPASRAAELAPAETVAYLEISDVARTMERWEKSELGALAKEPEWLAEEWQKGMEKWLWREGREHYLAQFLVQIYAEVKPLDPGGFFLAVTNVDHRDAPKMVAGISYRAKKAEVENAVRALKKERLFRAWPGAKSQLSKHEGLDIESIHQMAAPAGDPAVSGKGAKSPVGGFGSLGYSEPFEEAKAGPTLANYPALHLAFRDNWLFVATDQALLEGTLDRYLGKAGAPKSLAQDAVFAECRKHAVSSSDVVAWARWSPLGEKYAQGAFAWPAMIEAMAENPVQALHYSMMIEGQMTRDRLFYHLTKPPQPSGPAGGSPASGPPKSYLHASVNFELSRNSLERIHAAYWKTEQWDKFRARLAENQLGVADLWKAFGPEMQLVSVNNSGTWPEYVAALEIRDAGLARRFLACAEAQKAFDEPVTDRTGNPLKWSPSQEQSTLPPMVLTKTHLLIGHTAEGLREAASLFEGNGAGHVPETKIESSLAEVTLRLDGRRFFDHSKVWLRSKHAMTARMGHTDNVPMEAIYRHLLPTEVTMRRAGAGWEVEAVGTLGIVGNYFLVKYALD